MMPNNPTASSSRARAYQEVNGGARRALAGEQQTGGEHEHGDGRDEHAVAHRRAALARDEEDRQPMRQRRLT